MIGLCLSLVAVSFVITLVAGQVVLRGSLRLGLYDQIGGESHKQHSRPVPNTGGVAIYVATVLPILGILLAAMLISDAWWATRFPQVTPFLPGLRSMAWMGGGVVLCASALHAMGLYDDRRAMGPMLKLAVQVAVGLTLVLACDMRVLALLGGDNGIPMGGILSVAVSLLWIVAIINAMNFMDNMDGLTAGTGAVIAGIYLATTLLGEQWFVAGMAALLLGALLGFLVYNRHPAKMFMGDGGSLVVGMFLAVISIRTTYFSPAPTTTATSEATHWWGILIPLVVMAVPLYDLTTVTVIRLASGRSPFSGDHNHFSHRLVRRGMARPHAVVVIWLCTLTTGLGGVMLGSLQQWQAMLVAGQVVAILLLIAFLEFSSPSRDA